MANEVKTAVIQFLNDQVRECKSDDELLKLAGKIVGSKTGKKKLFEKLGLKPEEDPGEDDKAPDKETAESDGE